MEYADALTYAQSKWFGSDISESFTIDRETVYGHIVDNEGSERVSYDHVSIAFTARFKQSDFSAKPPVGKKITYAGTQYRVGESVYPWGDDWIVPLIEDVIEV